MSIIPVDVAQVAFSQEASATMRASSLGSSIGVGIYDPEAKAGGLFVFIFPSSQGSPIDPSEHPYLFADTGIKQFLAEARDRKIDLDRARIAVAGGAKLFDAMGIFGLGEKNTQAIEEVLAIHSIKPALMDVGGMPNRTLQLDLARGKLQVRTYGADILEA